MEKSKIDVMREMVKIQGNNGNYNYDNYMLGMYNGMELMLSIVEDREPNYKDGKKTTFLAGDRQTKGLPLNLQMFTDKDPEALAKGLGSPVRDEAYYKQERIYAEGEDVTEEIKRLKAEKEVKENPGEAIIEGFREGIRKGKIGFNLQTPEGAVQITHDLEHNDGIDALRYAPDMNKEPMDRNEYIKLAEFQKEEIRKLTRERDLWKYVTELFFDRLKDAPFNTIKDK